jgi:glycosyltransferase involved in cell wall biosynthesis
MLQDILRSRGGRVLRRVWGLKRRLAALKGRLARWVRRQPAADDTPPVPPAPAAAEPSAPQPAAVRLEWVGGPRAPSTRKFRVAFVLRPGVHDAASLRYRGFNIIEALHLSGIEAAHFDEEHLPDVLGRILSHDLIVLVRRPLTDKATLLLDAADQAGVPVVFDMDDYIFEEQIIPYVEWYRRQPPEVARNCVQSWRRCLDRCPYFTSSTPIIVDRVAELNKQSYLIRNGLNTVQLELSARVPDRKEPAAGGRLRLGYFSGTRTHQADFRLIAPVLVRLLDEFSHVNLVVAGDFDMAEFPEFSRFADRIETPPFVDWRALPAQIGRVDVNLIPLEINPFTEGKSDLKYYEAGLLRVPCVASPTQILARSIRHRVNGLLARTPEEWYEALRSLVTDAGLRQRLGRNAHEHVLREYVPEAIAREAVAAYRDVIQHHRRRQLGMAEDALTFTVLVSDIEQLVTDRSPVLPLAEELVRLGAGVTLWQVPGGRVATAVQADQLIGDHAFTPLFAIQVGGDIPCGDILLATDARTAHLAKAYEHRAWQVAYLIPEYEPAHLPAGEELRQAQDSYQLGLRHLALDDGLADLVSRHGGAVAVLPAWAVPREQPVADWTEPKKLLVHVPWNLPIRLWAQAVEALRRFYLLHPGVEILLGGVTAMRGMGIGAPHRQLGTPSGKELEALIAETPACLFLYTTAAPRWMYDLMAAGCPVVAAGGDVGPTPPGFNPRRGVLSVPLETESLVHALDAVIVNPVLRTALVQHAAAHARRMPPVQETARALLKIMNEPALTLVPAAAEDAG